MFIHAESGRPAWLISHDNDVTFSESADLGRPHHTVASHLFFAAMREATAAELKEFQPAARPAAKPAPPAKTTAAAKPKAAKKAAQKPKASRRSSLVGERGRTAAPEAPKPPAADKPPGVRSSAPGGEPHGE